MSSKLIQMCATLLGRRHLVNAYKMNAGWFTPLWINVWVAGKTVWTTCHSARLSTCHHVASHCSLSINFGQTAFLLALMLSISMVKTKKSCQLSLYSN